MGDSQQFVHLFGGVFVDAVLMVNKNVIRLFDLPRRLHSISVTPNTPPSTTPECFFASSSPAAVRLVRPFTISSAQPEKVKS